MVRPGGFELPTFWFVARRSIQLSYGRNVEEILAQALIELPAFAGIIESTIELHFLFSRKYFARAKNFARTKKSRIAGGSDPGLGYWRGGSEVNSFAPYWCVTSP